MGSSINGTQIFFKHDGKSSILLFLVYICCTRKKLQQHWWSPWTCSAYSLFLVAVECRRRVSLYHPKLDWRAFGWKWSSGRIQNSSWWGALSVIGSFLTTHRFASPGDADRLWYWKHGRAGPRSRLRIVQVRVCLLCIMRFQLQLATISLVPSHSHVNQDCYEYV